MQSYGAPAYLPLTNTKFKKGYAPINKGQQQYIKQKKRIINTGGIISP
jgi:hypothetical protein